MSRKKMVSCAVAVLLVLAAGAAWAAAPAAAKKPSPNEPSPQTRAFFVDGVSSEADVAAITAAVEKVKTVTKVEGLTTKSGFVNVSFDHHGVTHQQIAQAIADAGSFKPSFRFSIPDYAANAEKIDAIFAKVKSEVQIEVKNREKGEFTLYFLPLAKGEPGPHGIGFNFGKIGHPVMDPPPKGLGLKMLSTNPAAAKPPVSRAKRS
jgi:copper chaperone CopZ